MSFCCPFVPVKSPPLSPSVVFLIVFAVDAHFQKRGFPHAHILIIIDGDDKSQAEDYDKYVSAELPDPHLQPRLFHRVVSSMVHGPCGSKCQKDGECSKHYPKDYQAETSSANDGYVVYRRRPSNEREERTVNLDIGGGVMKTYTVGPRGVLLHGRWVDN